MAKLHEPPAECKESLAALRGRRACSSFPGAQTQPNELDRKIDRDPSRRKEDGEADERMENYSISVQYIYIHISLYIYTHIYIHIVFFDDVRVSVSV